MEPRSPRLGRPPTITSEQIVDEAKRQLQTGGRRRVEHASVGEVARHHADGAVPARGRQGTADQRGARCVLTRSRRAGPAAGSGRTASHDLHRDLRKAGVGALDHRVASARWPWWERRCGLGRSGDGCVCRTRYVTSSRTVGLSSAVELHTRRIAQHLRHHYATGRQRVTSRGQDPRNRARETAGAQ